MSVLGGVFELIKEKCQALPGRGKNKPFRGRTVINKSLTQASTSWSSKTCLPPHRYRPQYLRIRYALDTNGKLEIAVRGDVAIAHSLELSDPQFEEKLGKLLKSVHILSQWMK